MESTDLEILRNVYKCVCSRLSCGLKLPGTELHEKILYPEGLKNMCTYLYRCVIITITLILHG